MLVKRDDRISVNPDACPPAPVVLESTATTPYMELVDFALQEANSTMSETAIVKMTKPELNQLEAKVREGLQSFVEVGQALTEIRDRKGYELRNCATFEDYCETVFGFSRRHGYRLIEAAQTVEKVEAVLGEAPRNEAAARELSKVAETPKLLTRVKDKLAKVGKTVATATAEQIAQTVQQVTQPKPGNGKAEPAPARPETKMPTMTDICPGCGQTPTRYYRAEGDAGGFCCGNCNAPVVIGVIAAAPAACPACGFAIVGGAGFCANCGSVLK